MNDLFIPFRHNTLTCLAHLFVLAINHYIGIYYHVRITDDIKIGFWNFAGRVSINIGIFYWCKEFPIENFCSVQEIW